MLAVARIVALGRSRGASVQAQPLLMRRLMRSTKHVVGIRNTKLRGFSLVEIVVAVAIVAMLSAGVAAAVLAISARQKVSLTRTNAEALRGAVKMWRSLENESGTCPNVTTMVADGVLDRGKAVKQDAWGQPWTIECDERDATITSRGPDQRLGTEDDIRVPPT
jgi:prepilin-type N-terminal cleavage/methylation domain-containing protein